MELKLGLAAGLGGLACRASWLGEPWWLGWAWGTLGGVFGAGGAGKSSFWGARGVGFCGVFGSQRQLGLGMPAAGLWTSAKLVMSFGRIAMGDMCWMRLVQVGGCFCGIECRGGGKCGFGAGGVGICHGGAEKFKN